MIAATKYCPSCGQTKPTAEFSRDRGARDGLYGLCKLCDRERSRRNYADNRAARRARRRDYNTAHGDELRAYYRNYYTANAEALRANQRAYRLNNPEKIAGKKAVHRAIQHGELPRLQTRVCVVCGVQAADYHHHVGYAPEKQLTVVPLCRSCHKQAHAPASAMGNSSRKTKGAASVQLAFDFFSESL